jgi:hypothetical protein
MQTRKAVECQPAKQAKPFRGERLPREQVCYPQPPPEAALRLTYRLTTSLEPFD